MRYASVSYRRAISTTPLPTLLNGLTSSDVPPKRKAKNEDDAEAILLGCAGFAQFATKLEGDLHIPVLDGVVCAVKIAEAIVELGKTTSKYKTYRPRRGKRFRACSRSSDGSTKNTSVRWGKTQRLCQAQRGLTRDPGHAL